MAVERLLPLAPVQKMQLTKIVPSVLRVKVASQSSEQVIFQSTSEGSDTINKLEASTESGSESANIESQGESSWYRYFQDAASTAMSLASSPFSKLAIVSVKLLKECSEDNPDIELIKVYLNQEDCDVNVTENDEHKWTPLMWACEKRHTEISKLLLEHQPRVDIQNTKKWSALHLASRAGDLEIVQRIVEQGAEIDMLTNRKWTPLKWASQEGHADVAKFLLQNGAFVDSPDERGWTPLIQEGHVDVVNVLLDHGAKVNYQTDTNKGKWCALMAAAKNKHSEVVDTLIRRGAEVDFARDDNHTALHVASYYEDNSDVIKTLLQHKATIDIQTKEGMTPLMVAANRGHLESVRALIHGGADINKQHPVSGYTAIFFAAEKGHIDIFKELLAHKADTEISDLKVVDIANFFKHDEILSLLKKAGLSPGSAHKGTSVFDLIYEAYEAAQEYLKKFELPRSQQDADSPR